MSVIEKIAQRLNDHHPAFSTEVTVDTITVTPSNENGFLVQFRVVNDSFIVSFDGWHEEFDTEVEALNCFGFGLSEVCRLKILYRGSFAYRWTVESKNQGEWVVDSTTGLLLFPFWRRYRVVYRSNGRHSIATDDDVGLS